MIAEQTCIDEIRGLESLAARDANPQSLVQLRNKRLELHDHQGQGSTGDNTTVMANPGDLFPDAARGIPEIDAQDLDARMLASAMGNHGALIVRNLLGSDQADSLRNMIDTTFDVAERSQGWNVKANEAVDEKDAAWFEALPNNDGRRGAVHADFMLKTGSIETLMSPMVSYHLLATFSQLGLRDLFRSYFLDEPCVSFKKSVLRRSAPLKRPADWHQDGAFMSTDIKSLNLWVTLTHCGEGTAAPGIDLVPVRLTEIVDAGINGAAFDWSVSAASVASRFPDNPPVRPTFNAGDAIIFDHYNLHITSFDPSFTDTRYAIETWFFAMNSSPYNQSPVYW